MQMSQGFACLSCQNNNTTKIKVLNRKIMNALQEKILGLIIREIEGVITDQELNELQLWVVKSAENRRFYEETRRLWEIKPVDPSKIVIDKYRAWDKIKKDITKVEALETNSRIMPSQSKHIVLRIITGLAAMVLIWVGVYTLKPDAEDDITLITIENTENISSDPLVLPDGSTVWFNGLATLQYPEAFTHNDRELILQGNAFFDVKHLPQKSFTIFWEGSEIRVKGTSFDLRYTAQDSVLQLAVVTGKVVFVSPRGAVLPVNAGQMATLNLRTSVLGKTMIDNYNFLAWHTRKLEFKDHALTKVFEDLKIAYPIDIVWQGDMSQYKLTARFVNEEPEDIFNTISMLFNLSVTYDSDTWYVGK